MNEYEFEYRVRVTWSDAIDIEIDNMKYPKPHNREEQMRVQRMNNLNMTAIYKGFQNVLGGNNDE